MNLNDFISKYNGHGVDTDNAYGFQCMDLMHAYIRDCLGLPLSVLAAPTAYQAYLNGELHFDKFANTPTGVPQPGDIVFWNTTVGSAGHVAIFISGNANSFVSLDQNWPVGSVTHEQTHNYNGVAGWLRLKNNSAPAQEADVVTNNGDVNKFYVELLGRAAYDFTNNKWIDPSAEPWVGQEFSKVFYEISDSPESQAYRTTLAGYPKQVTDLQTQLQAQHDQIDQLNAKVSQLSNQPQGQPVPVTPVPGNPPTNPAMPKQTLLGWLYNLIIGHK